ncbi:hypothetical protein [Candidatus Contubernalis alkaliaceticus]|uniref:hypothetical protein n=1 Tax=Candidatus Contubernalis alkaliaceticus TaxID=338645 RepID=UPI001F4C3C29|nr:hypothetical protein [Candidatus Contubernalis alkalaceticus]UNC93301.1 hypothetical protein HUE98_15120 [Candidatus Contubernalis alkalaceticus]
MSGHDQAQKTFWKLQKQYFTAIHEAEIANLVMKEHEEGFREGNMIEVVNNVINAQIKISLTYMKLESHILKYIDREFSLFNPEDIDENIPKKREEK